MADAKTANSLPNEPLPDIQQLQDIVLQFRIPLCKQSASDVLIVPHASSDGFSSAKIWQVWLGPLQEQTAKGLWLPGTSTNPGSPEQDFAISSDLKTSPSRWCLRCWPREEPTAQRLGWIHRYLEQAAEFCPQILLPLKLSPGAEAQTWTRSAGDRHANADRFVSSQGRLWQLEPWATGTNDYLCLPTSERLESVMRSLAVLHRVWWDRALEPHRVDWDGNPYSTQGVSPGLLKRWQQTETLLHAVPQILHDSQAALTNLGFDSQTEVEPWRKLIFDIQTSWDLRKNELRQRLAFMSRQNLPLGPVLADIWSDHLFFSGSQLSAIIDYGALRIDNVAADLSRVMSSLVGNDQHQREQALAIYQHERSLEPRERAAIDAFDLSSQLLGPLHWLRWVFLEHRFPPNPNLRSRIRSLLDQQPF